MCILLGALQVWSPICTIQGALYVSYLQITSSFPYIVIRLFNGRIRSFSSKDSYSPSRIPQLDISTLSFLDNIVRTLHTTLACGWVFHSLIEYLGILWNSPELSRFLHFYNLLDISWTFKTILESSLAFYNSLEHSRTFRTYLEISSLLWRILDLWRVRRWLSTAQIPFFSIKAKHFLFVLAILLKSCKYFLVCFDKKSKHKQNTKTSPMHPKYFFFCFPVVIVGDASK